MHVAGTPELVVLVLRGGGRNYSIPCFAVQDILHSFFSKATPSKESSFSMATLRVRRAVCACLEDEAPLRIWDYVSWSLCLLPESQNRPSTKDGLLPTTVRKSAGLSRAEVQTSRRRKIEYGTSGCANARKDFMHLIRPLHHRWRRSERGLPIQFASPGGRTRWPAIQLSNLGLDVCAGSHSLCVHDLESASMAHD